MRADRKGREVAEPPVATEFATKKFFRFFSPSVIRTLGRTAAFPVTVRHFLRDFSKFSWQASHSPSIQAGVA